MTDEVVRGPGRSTAARHPAVRSTAGSTVALVALVALGLLQLAVLYAPTAPAGPEVTGLDKVVHASVFGAPALLALLDGRWARWVLPALVVHAPVSELLQAWLLVHRDGDVWDCVADLTGVLLALGAFVVWRRLRR